MHASLHRISMINLYIQFAVMAFLVRTILCTKLVLMMFFVRTALCTKSAVMAFLVRTAPAH